MSNDKQDSRRFEIIVDGKHQGGSFATEAEANKVAATFKGQETVVQRKGKTLASAASSPAPSARK